MAGVRDRGLIKAGPWPLGVDNTSQEGELARDEFGQIIALREAVNVVLSSGGRPRRRKGFAAVNADTAHSLWSAPLLQHGFFVKNGQLTALLASGETAPVAPAVFVVNPLSFALINDRVYFSNDAVCGMVDLGLQAWSWAPEHPAGQPTLAIGAGSLDKGRYQVAVTFVDWLGRESGSTLAAEIELPNGGGIVVTDIPTPSEGGTNVYVTGANDQVLRLYDSAAVWPSGLTVSAPATGRALMTQFLEPLPPGNIVRGGHGRQWVARGNELFWSEPLRYGMFNRAKNRMRFAAPIDLVEPIGDGTGGAGVFVAAGNHTYWYGDADPAKWTQVTSAHAGAIPGSSVTVKGTVLGLASPAPVLVWLSRSGKFVVGTPGGGIAEIKNKAVVDIAESAATLVREDSGDTFITASLRSPAKHALAVSDVATTHIVSRAPR